MLAMKPILLVEDSPEVRKALEIALKSEGWPVAATADGRAALAWIQHYEPALVLLDWRLPDCLGDVVATGLRLRYDGSIPIILVSADSPIADNAQQISARAYLEKPFSLDELILVCQRELTP